MRKRDGVVERVYKGRRVCGPETQDQDEGGRKSYHHEDVKRRVEVVVVREGKDLQRDVIREILGSLRR